MKVSALFEESGVRHLMVCLCMAAGFLSGVAQANEAERVVGKARVIFPTGDATAVLEIDRAAVPPPRLAGRDGGEHEC